MTRWLLNSAVLAAGAYGTYEFSPATVDDLREFVALPFISRIGYAETAEVIERWTGVLPAPSREGSPLEAGDTAMIVRLKYRVDPALKGAPIGANPSDWEIALLRRIS